MSVRLPQRPQLCLVTDPNVPDLVEKVETALAAGVTMLQLRGHTLSAAQLYHLAQTLHPHCQRYGASLIVNDRLDVGLAVGAHGFQLGTHSLPLAVARHIVGQEYLLGASVHTLEQARQAVSEGADFLLAGTVFASASHPAGPISGPGLLRAMKQAFPAVPLLAIGGISVNTARQVMETGTDGIAVISAILGATDVAQAVKMLREALKEQ